jgi:shikimate dehydrogenase
MTYALAGVLGRPIGHSRSPRIHRHWLARHGIRGDYVAMEVAEADLAEAVAALPRLGFSGVNVTVPHKVAALALADEATEAAARMGAANVLSFEGGRVRADNTDGAGFLAALREGAPGWAPGASCVLGAGGAARAVVAALVGAGAEVVLTNRTRGRAEALAADVGGPVRVVDWVAAGNAVEEAGTVVNATSLGLSGGPPLRVPLDGLRRGQVVMDLVYDPLETPLLREARAVGAVAIDGLGMLLHQAAPPSSASSGPAPSWTRTCAGPPSADGAARLRAGPHGLHRHGQDDHRADARGGGRAGLGRGRGRPPPLRPGRRGGGVVGALVPGAVGEGVDRAALRAALLADPALLPRLEAAVHPLVAQDRAAFLAGAEGVAVLDVPLLFERGIDAECDGVAVASASRPTQMARLRARGLSEAEAALLLARQMPDGEKRARARWVVPTETLEEARAAVATILRDIAAGVPAALPGL